MTDKANWLTGLQVGDFVYMRWCPGCHARLQQITRLTKTRFVAEDGHWFRRRDGCNPDSSWYQLEKPPLAQARRIKAGKAASRTIYYRKYLRRAGDGECTM